MEDSTTNDNDQDSYCQKPVVKVACIGILIHASVIIIARIGYPRKF